MRGQSVSIKLNHSKAMHPHLILPMAGAGARFGKKGYIVPKPLIEIAGKPFFFWAVMSLRKFIDLADITFVVLHRHVEEYQINREIERYFPGGKIIVLPNILQGPVFTCIEGAKEIDDDEPIIFNDCDHMFRASTVNEAFYAGSFDADGALLTFESSEPQFSYVRYAAGGRVAGTVEKTVVSNKAICGAYIFRNAKIFRSAAEQYVPNCPYGECFMSGLYNVLCDEGKKVTVYPLDYHVEFGTPEEYEKAKASSYFSEIL